MSEDLQYINAGENQISKYRSIEYPSDFEKRGSFWVGEVQEVDGKYETVNPKQRYAIETKKGAGGMANVHKALDLETGRQVAIKFLKPDSDKNEALKKIELLRREAITQANIQTPRAIRVDRVFVTKDYAPNLSSTHTNETI